MSKILIENYRGFDIEFNTQYEKFQCIITDDLTKESLSFKSIKSFVDEYMKNNQTFKPFYVVTNPESYRFNNVKRLKVIGIRKDGRLAAETPTGLKVQLGNYDISDFIIEKDKNQQFMVELNKHDSDVKKQAEANKVNRNAIISKMDIVTLKDYKKEIVG